MYINNNYSFRQSTNYSGNVTISNKTCNQNYSFTGTNINAVSEKGLQKGEYILRIIANRISDFFESRKTKQITKNIAQIVPESSEKYLNQLEEISRYFSTGKIIDVNVEDKILEKMASSGKSAIFIMNHSNQKQDPSMLAVLNTLLAKAYKEFDRVNDFPIPKIILNQDILKTMNPVKRKAFEAFGAVGIDANVYSADKAQNARAFLPVMKDFIKNKANIFIFPEGKLAVRTDLDFENRFQAGVAELINKVLAVKKEVDVVPVGFSYGKGKNKAMTGIHIGEPLKFTREEEKTTTTKGNILKSEFAFSGFVNFFKKHQNETDIVITENGIPVKPVNVTDYIKSILCENLNICSKEAEKRIIMPPVSDEIISY